MKLITRRVLFFICSIVFVILSPLVILYAFGFRYDFSQNKVVQTGIIYLTPNIQSDINILIDGKNEPNKISIKGIFKKDYVVYNLLPKTYNIKIEKNNYHAWEKNLVVTPGLITYAEPLLLPSNPKIDKIFTGTDIAAWSLSEKSKKIFYFKNNGDNPSVGIYDIAKNTNNLSTLATLTGKNIKITPLTQNHKIIYASDGNKFATILSADTTEIILFGSDIDIKYIANIDLTDIMIDGYWDNSSRYFVYLSEKGYLYYYDTNFKKSSKIMENILGFTLKNNDIYYLNKENLLIYKTSIQSPHDQKQLSFLPVAEENFDKIAGKTKMIISDNESLAIITPKKELFILTKNGVPENLGNNIESVSFSRDGKNIVFNSPFEIFTNTIGSYQEELITRSSQTFSNVSWYYNYSHIWYLLNQTIKNIELDQRPTPNIIDLATLSKKPSKIIYGNTNIYYDQKDDDALTIYRINIE